MITYVLTSYYQRLNCIEIAIQHASTVLSCFELQNNICLNLERQKIRKAIKSAKCFCDQFGVEHQSKIVNRICFQFYTS